MKKCLWREEEETGKKEPLFMPIKIDFHCCIGSVEAQATVFLRGGCDTAMWIGLRESITGPSDYPFTSARGEKKEGQKDEEYHLLSVQVSEVMESEGNPFPPLFHSIFSSLCNMSEW